jgi:hypothetical protein
MMSEVDIANQGAVDEETPIANESSQHSPTSGATSPRNSSQVTDDSRQSVSKREPSELQERTREQIREYERMVTSQAKELVDREYQVKYLELLRDRREVEDKEKDEIYQSSMESKDRQHQEDIDSMKRQMQSMETAFNDLARETSRKLAEKDHSDHASEAVTMPEATPLSRKKSISMDNDKTVKSTTHQRLFFEKPDKKLKGNNNEGDGDSEIIFKLKKG